MSVLELFNFSENLEVLLGVLELLSLDSDNIVELALKGLLSSVDFFKLLIDLLLNTISLVILVLSLLMQLLLSGLYLHKSSSIFIVIFL